MIPAHAVNVRHMPHISRQLHFRSALLSTVSLDARSHLRGYSGIMALVRHDSTLTPSRKFLRKMGIIRVQMFLIAI